jgi:hypothetical protein
MAPETTDLAYSYEPTDFFEASTTITLRSGCAKFDAGEVVLTLSRPRLVGHAEAPAFTHEVRAALRTRQLLTGRCFSLLGPRITHQDAEGHRHHVMLAETGRFELRGFPVDIHIQDTSGATIRDTKAERIREETTFFGEVAPKASANPELSRMLESYGRSFEDPANALVNLYEIRDAATTHFQTEATARARLKVSRDDWSALGRLANDEALREGRHRGQQAALRPATPDELAQARRIARRIIESFARHLL